jgi:photosystem II stability/assembly factor-like uncharacterized protein
MPWSFAIRPANMTFRQGKLGGGGFVTAYKVSADGSMRLHTTDVVGAYVWEDGEDAWVNVLNNLPAPYNVLGTNPTVWDMAFAPSDPDILYYAMLGQESAPIFRSTDRGATWTATNTSLYTHYGLGHRLNGPRMAVDPLDPDVVYVGDSYGRIYYTDDGFATSTQVTDLLAGLWDLTTSATTSAAGTTLTFASVPSEVQNYVALKNNIHVYAHSGTDPDALGNTYLTNLSGSSSTTLTLGSSLAVEAPGIGNGDTIYLGASPVIHFDSSGGSTGGKTNNIYVAWHFGSSFNSTGGIWASDDAGATWASMANSPGNVIRMDISAAGDIIACRGRQWTGQADAQNLFRYTSSTWSNLSASFSSGWDSVSFDPINSGRVCVMSSSGALNRSDDNGTNWYGAYANEGIMSVEAGDPPYLAWTYNDFFSNSGCTFDPITSNRLWCAQGIGVWYTSPLASAAQPTWVSRTRGNDELISYDIRVHPNGTGHAFLGVHDRGVFRLTDPDVFPSSHGVDSDFQFVTCTDYAKDDPSFIVALQQSAGGTINLVWYNENYGADADWVQTATNPGLTSGSSGSISAATTLNWVIIPDNNGTPRYTDDGGATWADCLFDGETISAGWGFAYYNGRRIACADPENVGTFYAYNYQPVVSGDYGGVWKSTDGGATWDKITSIANGPEPTAQLGTAALLLPVPGKDGHLWFSPGFISGTHPLDYTGARSVDGGLTWVELTGMQEIQAMGIGAAWGVGPNTYPAIYVAGYVQNSSTPGIFRCVNATDDPLTETLEWERLSSNPAGSVDDIKCIAADPDTFGRIWMGTGATGYIFGTV